ncbi:MAG: hypothetical protein JRI95_05145 [Deltaproteobacteria bacterium]|nr:hypothetical protein [Deltaproteobacteria bacterium]MBW2086941.1 hypothetical protein [Deltaproteobacteria bacterium]
MQTDVSTERIVVTDELAGRFGLEKGLELIRKACATPLAKEAVNEEERSIISIISTGDVDRDGDVLRPDGMNDQAFRRHPIVLFGHRYQELPIGRNEWIRVLGKKVIAKTVYVPGDINPFAERIFFFRQRGFPLAQSIGFIAVETTWVGEDDFGEELEDVVSRGWVQKDQRNLVRRIIKKWILYEYSDVVVPANPEALALAVSKGLVTASEAERFEDKARKPGAWTSSPLEPEQGDSPSALIYLGNRIERVEAEKKALKAEIERLKKKCEQKDLQGDVITLEGLERILPAITRVFQKEVKEASREFTHTLARITGKVTLPL